MKKSKQDIFVQAYDMYQKSLLRCSYFKINNKELADDLVQTTFLKTWEYLLKAGKIDSMKAFLFHVLNNLIIDEYRKKKIVSLDILLENGFQISFDDTEKLINMLDGKNAITMIPLLPEKYSKVISMKYLDEMSLAEIAQATHQSKNTVAVQIHRGIEQLAVLMKIRDDFYSKN